jgi:CRISP-associated protein Cas1
MEELRPTIVDAVVLRCVTTGMIKPEDFETVPDRGCLMTDRARHTYLAAYERRMLTLFTHAGTGRRVSYRVGLGLQAKALARTLVDSARSYHPIRWK